MFFRVTRGFRSERKGPTLPDNTLVLAPDMPLPESLAPKLPLGVKGGNISPDLLDLSVVLTYSLTCLRIGLRFGPAPLWPELSC